MMHINLDEKERHLEPLIAEFNRLCHEGYYPEILSWSHYDLYLKTMNITPQQWKEFRLNPKIKQWFEEEEELQLRTTVTRLIQETGDSRSTAQSQTLNALLAQLNRIDQHQATTKIIYNFVPLTEFEKENPNVNILSYIPSEIRGAIQVIGRDTSKNTKE